MLKFTQVCPLEQLRVNDRVYIPGYKRPCRVIAVLTDGVKVKGGCRVYAKNFVRVFIKLSDAVR